ncbi:MAG TPA: DNA primase [Acidimicrobiales bacterium]|nr:DNA primase [Acidimicrobiales bacterium]
MGIPDEDVAQVRSATDIVALIGEYTPLKRVGRRFVGLCPFHSEKTGSFSVNGEEGLYYCFGCQASGDAITFLKAIEGCDFVEAVERLGARAGITVRQEAGGRTRHDHDQTEALKEAMRRAVAFYHERLLSHPDANHARQYLRSRGYDGDVVRRFRLGWSPERGANLAKVLKMPAAVLSAAGLTNEGSYGPQDSFRGRVMFPIYDPSGTPIALGGRILPGGTQSSDGAVAGPKYRNSKETAIYSKRRTLYGLNWARQGIVQAGEIVVCEGYTDVIGLFTAGIPRAVATCGTALTDEHFQVIARFAKRVVLAFDADAAGQSAASRFYEWERRHDLEVAVAALPAGSDPGELAQLDPEALRKAIEGAQPFLGFRVERALSAGELRSPEGRARAAAAAVAMIAEHPNELVRDQYLVTIADRTRIEVDRLRPFLDRPVAAPSKLQMAPRRQQGSRGQRAARDGLVLAIHAPSTMAGRLDESLFADPLQRAAYLALAGATSLHEAIEGAEEDVADLLRQLAVSEPEADADPTIVQLVRAAATRALGDLEAGARAAEADGDEDRLLSAAAGIAQLKADLEIMQEPGVNQSPPRPVIEAADRLLGWLRSRRGEWA